MKITIKFKKWEEYQYRKQSEKVENTQWFRFENRIIYHAVWDELDGDEFKVFICLMCLASLNKNSGIIQTDEKTLSRRTCIDEKVVLNCIKKLKRLQIVEARTLHGRYADVTNVAPTEPDTTEPDQTKPYPIQYNLAGSASQNPVREKLNFEEVYAKYPRKEGKQAGMRKCKAQIKTQDELNDLSRAVDRYVQHLTSTGTESRFIKHFSTFMSEWRDWLDPEVGETVKIEQIKPRIRLTAADLSD